MHRLSDFDCTSQADLESDKGRKHHDTNIADIDRLVNDYELTSCD